MIDNTLRDNSIGQAGAIDECVIADVETNTIGQIIFSLAVIIALSVGIYVARGWKSETALFPLTVGYPMLALTVINLILTIARAKRLRQNVALSVKISAIDLRNGSLPYLGWMVSFVLAIWTLGFPIAAVLYVFLYMKLQGGMSWRPTIIYSLASLAFITVVFGMAFEVVWPTGALFQALGIQALGIQALGI